MPWLRLSQLSFRRGPGNSCGLDCNLGHHRRQDLVGQRADNSDPKEDDVALLQMVRPGLGFKSLHIARRTIAGDETLAMVCKR